MPLYCRQLEVLANKEDGTVRGSLLQLMDHTRTAFGGRLLRHWLAHPSCDLRLIAARQDAVQEIAEAAGSGLSS